MKNRSKDLIYIYDDENHQIIMIDGETGEKISQEDDQVTSILKYLYDQHETPLLRKFAVWCAQQINNELKPIQKKMLDLAEDAIHNDADTQDLKDLYQKTEGTAIATDTVGLRQGATSAPAYLAARECVNPDVLEGAIQAARFHRLWAEMKQADENDDSVGQQFMTDFKARITEGAIQQVQEQQTNYLLDMMNQ